MANLKVTAPLLNKRSLPVTDTSDKGNIIGTVKKGFQFESVEQLTNAAGDWFRDRDGSWYWGGGLSEISNLVQVLAVAPAPATPGEVFQFDPAKISWAHTALKITAIWQDAKVAGKNVRVAILDGGFDTTHVDLKPLLSESFFSGQGQVEHGTNMAGMIGAKGNKVTGIAPECDMLFVKIDFDNADSISKALQWANQNNADIISLSFRCAFDDKIETALKNCSDNNIAIITAIGNSGELNTVIDTVYPAKSPFCFAVGCFGKDFKRMAVSNFSNNLQLLAPAEGMLKAKAVNDTEISDGETSLATAFTCGVAALLLSVARKTNSNAKGKQIMEALCQHADKRNNGNADRNTEYGFGLIAPFQTYIAIK